MPSPLVARQIVNQIVSTTGVSTARANTLAEKTAGNGVSVDGVTLKDSGVTADSLTVGDGGTVTQDTGITTGVTLNTASGQITTVSQTVAAGADATFTVTNSAVAAVDNVIVSLASTSSAGGPWLVYVSAIAAGSFDITIRNDHDSAAGDDTLVINFIVIKGSAS